jgi:hypothetical protein
MDSIWYLSGYLYHIQKDIKITFRQINIVPILCRMAL